MPEDAAAVEHLHRLDVVRERAWMLLAAAERGQSDHFQPSAEAVDTVAVALAGQIRETCGEAPPPLANLWQRLESGQPAALERLAESLRRQPGGEDGLTRARSGADLVVLYRVLAPGGMAADAPALAALVDHLAAGGWSAREPAAPRLDAPGLRRLLAGDADRPPPPALAELLADASVRQRLDLLARGLEQMPELFGVEGRFGELLDRLLPEIGATVTAQQLIDQLAPLIDPIVSSTVRIGGRNAGDVWRHPLAWAEDRSREIVPFHALLVALAVDLVAPLEEAGGKLADLDQLPVPADRTLAGGVLRLGLVRPRHAAIGRLRHPPGSDIVVEIRALSLALAERLVDRLRAELGRTVHDLPVVRIVEPLAQLAAEWRDQPGPGIAINATTF